MIADPCPPHADAARPVAALRGPERRLVELLRLWTAGREGMGAAWSALAADLGPARARACLTGLEDVLAILRRAAWTAPGIAAPGDVGLTADEEFLAGMVMAAAEQRREAALERALFVVRPEAILPLVLAASRLGLPLVCAECRARLAAAMRSQ